MSNLEVFFWFFGFSLFGTLMTLAITLWNRRLLRSDPSLTCDPSIAAWKVPSKGTVAAISVCLGLAALSVCSLKNRPIDITIGTALLCVCAFVPTYMLVVWEGNNFALPKRVWIPLTVSVSVAVLISSPVLFATIKRIDAIEALGLRLTDLSRNNKNEIDAYSAKWLIENDFRPPYLLIEADWNSDTKSTPRLYYRFKAPEKAKNYYTVCLLEIRGSGSTQIAIGAGPTHRFHQDYYATFLRLHDNKCSPKFLIGTGTYTSVFDKGNDFNQASRELRNSLPAP